MRRHASLLAILVLIAGAFPAASQDAPGAAKKHLLPIGVIDSMLRPDCTPVQIREASDQPRVPRLVGCRYDVVAPFISEFFHVNPVKVPAPDNRPAGIITLQYPPLPEAKLPLRFLRLTVSSGPASTTTPQTTATDGKGDNGRYNPKQQTGDNSNSIGTNQTPTIGTKGPDCTPLRIREASDQPRVPRLVGCRYDVVAPFISEFFHVNPVKVPAPDNRPAGIITLQYPPLPEAKLPLRFLTLTVSSGPASTTTPQTTATDGKGDNGRYNPKQQTGGNPSSIGTNDMQGPDCTPLRIREAADQPRVPRLVGCRYDVVERPIWDFFHVHPVEIPATNNRPAGIITLQYPPLPEARLPLRFLTLTVSTGPAPATTPQTTATDGKGDNSNSIGTKPTTTGGKGGKGGKGKSNPKRQSGGKDDNRRKSSGTGQHAEPTPSPTNDGGRRFAPIATYGAGGLALVLASWLAIRWWRRPNGGDTPTPLDLTTPPVAGKVTCEFQFRPAMLQAAGPLIDGPRLAIAVEFQAGVARSTPIAVLSRRTST